MEFEKDQIRTLITCVEARKDYVANHLVKLCSANSPDDELIQLYTCHLEQIKVVSEKLKELQRGNKG